jgi:hypothetical protein
MKEKFCFASFKSTKKVVGSVVGSGSGSNSQRYGSGIRIRTKMSRIPYTDEYGTYSHKEEGGGWGELTREKVRGAIVHKAGVKYYHD